MEIRSFNFTFILPSFSDFRLRLLINFKMVLMNTLPQRTFLSGGVTEDFLRYIAFERIEEIFFDELMEGSLTANCGVGFKVSRVLMHGDMYYSIEDTKSRRRRCWIGVVNRHTLFVLQVRIPDGMGKEILSHG